MAFDPLLAMRAEDIRAREPRWMVRESQINDLNRLCRSWESLAENLQKIYGDKNNPGAAGFLMCADGLREQIKALTPSTTP